ncbi:Aspartate aminotransferase [Quillaja saponaria]|uniref:Aspartate aminotransferase n=1 Tax=Quillaja saponaria TaxID=32244 RepID=A0AAD7VET2_QUISA|nr:Aspartate aminotransferase [Quillaja saponaria]
MNTFCSSPLQLNSNKGGWTVTQTLRRTPIWMNPFDKCSKAGCVRGHDKDVPEMTLNSVILLSSSCFPNFPAPTHEKKKSCRSINSDFNQYRHVEGICDQLANIVKEMHSLDVNSSSDIAVACGQSEAFAAAIFAIIGRGDEVILFDPSYKSHEGCITMAGGVPVYVALDRPQWTLDVDKLMRSLTGRTKAIVLNSRNFLAITDEVYEHVTFDNEKDISLASFPGMQELTIITSSLSKTFSVTGWRIEWAIAPAFIASIIRNIHFRLTDSAPAPFQEAALAALRSPLEYFESLRKDYELKRDYIMKLLARIGFQIPFKPQGSFFLFVELPENCSLSDVEYVKKLKEQAGVVAVPGCGFFHTNLSSEKSSELSSN